MNKKTGCVLLVIVMCFTLFIVFYKSPVKESISTPDSGFDSSYDSDSSDFGYSSSWDSDSSSGGSGRSVADIDHEVIKEYFGSGFTLKNYWKFFKSWDHFRMFFQEMFFHSFLFFCIYFLVGKKKSMLIYYGIASFILFLFPFVFLFIGEFFALIIGFLFGNRKKKKMSNTNIDYKDIDLSPYRIDPDTIHQEIYDIYVRIQEAWMNYKLDDVKDSLSDELYNQYIAQLNTLEVKNQRNIMSDFKCLNCAIIGIDEKEGTQILDVRLKVNCRDYIIDDKTKKVLRGDKRKLHTYNYELHFERSEETVVTKCPNCGAELDSKGQNITCPYCNSKIIRKSKNLVLRKKEMISQD